MTTDGPKLLATVKDVHTEIEDVVMDLDAIKRRLAQIRGRLGVAVVTYDSGAATELPDDPRNA